MLSYRMRTGTHGRRLNFCVELLWDFSEGYMEKVYAGMI